MIRPSLTLTLTLTLTVTLALRLTSMHSGPCPQCPMLCLKKLHCSLEGDGNSLYTDTLKWRPICRSSSTLRHVYTARRIIVEHK